VVLSDEPPPKEEKDPESEDYLDSEQLQRLRKEGGKVSFEEMGKIIGMRWKNIDPDRHTKFSTLASQDTERYKKEMEAYNGRQEAKMRSDALKAPVAPDPYHHGSSSSAMSGHHDVKYDTSSSYGMGMVGGAGYMDHQGYGNHGSMMGGGYYGGMDFGGYGMGMGNMYGPYGYPDMSQMHDPGSGYGRGGGGGGMYGSGGYQGSMMGYGGQGSGYDQGGAMDPSAQGGMYGSYGTQGWGQQ
jgi:hypothetical protein